MKPSNFLLRELLFISCITSAFSASFASASDLAKELRIADQTVETLFIGEALWLYTIEREGATKVDQAHNNNRFLALFDQDEKSDKAIIMIHGTGQGPATPFVIGPLREMLSEQGYNTLSLQMPVLNEQANYQDYRAEFNLSRARISAGIAYLHKNSIDEIVLLGHSMGSAMLIDWVAEHSSDQLKAVITLGLGSTASTKNLPPPAKLDVPMLDIFGEQDYPAVLQQASKRQTAITKTHIHSMQIKIPSADHFYNGKESDVSEQLLAWLASIDE